VTDARYTLGGEPFVMLTRELLASDTWRALGINARRFVDFLMLENMAHGGKENGRLKAPYEQLETFGVGARYLADAIREAEDLGLVDCRRGGMRVATIYALTWLPLYDGTPATHRWRLYRNLDLRPPPTQKIKNLPAKGKAELPAKGKADGAKIPKSTRKREGRSAENLPAKWKVLSRRSYQGGAIVSEVGRQEPVVGDQRVGDPAGSPNGHAAR
jgi:hypothetical protein